MERGWSVALEINNDSLGVVEEWNRVGVENAGATVDGRVMNIGKVARSIEQRMLYEVKIGRIVCFAFAL